MCWDVHCLAIFEKTRACFIITKAVNGLHSLLGLKMFHDLFGTLLGDVQLFTFSDVRSLTYKWTKSIFTLAFMHFWFLSSGVCTVAKLLAIVEGKGWEACQGGGAGCGEPVFISLSSGSSGFSPEVAFCLGKASPHCLFLLCPYADLCPPPQGWHFGEPTGQRALGSGFQHLCPDGLPPALWSWGCGNPHLVRPPGSGCRLPVSVRQAQVFSGFTTVSLSWSCTLRGQSSVPEGLTCGLMQQSRHSGPLQP